MKLISFSVTNFRSITKAYKIPLSDMSILIGKNNEGKSNLLKALDLVLRILRKHAENGRFEINNSFFRRIETNSYDWKRDFPISLQSRKSNWFSIFRLEFDLLQEEIVEFKEKLGSNLNGNLLIQVKLGKERKPIISVVKQGKGSKMLNLKSVKIAKYITDRVHFNYIPTIRTDEQSMKIVSDIAFRKFEKLRQNKEYVEALRIIADLQKPILNSLSDKIKTSLVGLLPKIKDVSIELNDLHQRHFFMRNELDIMIDDGNKTSLKSKGDGVKSLAAMALLKDMSFDEGIVSLVAIEEPESHLHPEAIHILKDTIYALSKTSQVIISTHNPLFVDRENVTSNIIVDSGKAVAAKKIKQIRDVLGIRASDNLQNANYVLLVEGVHDVNSLKVILPMLSPKIAKYLKNNLFVIQEIGGTGNLSYKLSLLQSTLCVYHVFLDNDKSAKESFGKVSKLDNLEIKDVNFTNCLGMKESEFEDVLDVSVYKDSIESKYGVNLDVKEFNNKRKWSERMKNVFEAQGKPWSTKIEFDLKDLVVSCIQKKPQKILNKYNRTAIDYLVKALEAKLK